MLVIIMCMLTFVCMCVCMVYIICSYVTMCIRVQKLCWNNFRHNVRKLKIKNSRILNILTLPIYEIKHSLKLYDQKVRMYRPTLKTRD